MSKTQLALLTATAFFLMLGCHSSKTESNMKPATDQELLIQGLRDAYAAFNRGDIDAAVQLLSSDVEWIEPKEFPGGGTYHGRNGAKQYLTQSRAAWAEVHSEPEQFIPVGDRIVVFVHARVRAKGSDQWQEVRLADVYTFRNGQAVSMQAFADRKQALGWVGISN
jgi:ketosteroid isomerase-like protein